MVEICFVSYGPTSKFVDPELKEVRKRKMGGGYRTEESIRLTNLSPRHISSVSDLETDLECGLVEPATHRSESLVMKILPKRNRTPFGDGRCLPVLPHDN
jgi:hypothetical protein